MDLKNRCDNVGWFHPTRDRPVMASVSIVIYLLVLYTARNMLIS
jgi:hypothetical protein